MQRMNRKLQHRRQLAGEIKAASFKAAKTEPQ